MGATRRGGAGAAVVLALAAGTTPVGAQDLAPQRSPAGRQTVVQLAYVLGEAHALHRLCAGAADATWYDRMERLEAQEASDEAFRHRLVDSFNAGFASRQAQFPACGRASETAERRVAAEGGALARRLSSESGE